MKEQQTPASGTPPSRAGAADRLDSWKEIAAYLKRGARTVQRWEREEGLPVHRLLHDKLGSVYAYRAELNAWWAARGTSLEEAPQADPAAGPSVAVLPFADLSREQDQAYFCEGVAEEIRNALSRIQGMRVSSRTASFRFRARSTGIREIGRQLKAGTLLEGSVRKAGERVRIAVQLTSAESGFQLWSARYDRELQDIFAIQDEIAENVARALEVTLSQKEAAALQTPPTSDVRAYDCYLQGRTYYYQYSPRGVEYALKMFIRAMELDPNYAQAYAGLADCWSYVYLYSDRSETVRQQAEWASRKAVEMDPGSAQAQASRGLSLSLCGNNDEAEKAFRAAIAFDKGLFEAYYFYARHCFALGRLEESARLYEQAMQARPEDFQSPLLVAQCYDALKRPAEAGTARKNGVRIAEKHLELHPDDTRALYMAANGMAALGEKVRARQYAERALAVSPADPMLLYNVGCIFSLLGLVESALDCLEKAAAGGLTQKGWYENDSNLDPLRRHRRFKALLSSLG